MTPEDLIRAGYSRALWVPSLERYWLRPGGTSVCPEAEALREIGEPVDPEDGGDE